MHGRAMLRRNSSATRSRSGKWTVRRALLIGVALQLSLLSVSVVESTVFAQAVQPSAPPAALPEPIYWKQHLFLIPYQWGSAAQPGAARAVWLFVSKDRGASWQKISEAK